MNNSPSHYLFPADYMADPSAHVFDGRIYIYPSHDRDAQHAENDNGDHFSMRDYHVLRLDGDPMTCEATDCGRVLDVDDIPWASRQLWDNDVVERDGRYYMVFCCKDKSGVFRLGVATSDSPEGPFQPEPDPIRGSYSIDPCLLKDDDGEVYCYFGGIWGGQLQCYKNNELVESPTLPKGTERAICPRVARMTADTLQFAELPRKVLILDEHGQPMQAENPHHFFEASWVVKDQGRYVFIYSTGDTHLICYAVGQSPFGPFHYQGVLLDPVVGWTTHSSLCRYRGKWYLFHHDSQPSGGTTWLRSLKVKEVELTINESL